MSGSSIRWNEQLLFSLAFVAWVEGPFFYSDLMRGVSVGLAIGALLTLIAGRYVLPAIACAGLVVMSFMMTPRTPVGLPLALAHVLAAMMLLIPLTTALHRMRTARSGKQEVAG